MKFSKIAIASLAAFASLAVMTACNDDDVDINSFPPPAPADAQVSNPTEKLIYEANPLFFASDNCFDAMKSRLGEIKDLGTDILWIMPVCTPGQKDAIGSPYCIKDFKGLNPKYGDMAAFKSLVNEAHSKGMIVILDWIANHTAWDNVWITEHPDWFVKDANGNIISPVGQGWTDVAQLDFNNPQMRAAMVDAMTYWIREAGIDGFRCDYADGVPADFWAEAIKGIRGVKADAFMLAESNNFNLYAAGFDMIYDWSFAADLQKVFKGSNTVTKLIEAAAQRDAQIPQGKNIMRFVLNHDFVAENAPSQLYGSSAAVVPAYVVAAFTGQVPLVYSGMEAGFNGKTSFMNAKPLNWNAALQAEYATIGKAYKATETARAGSLKAYEVSKQAAVFSATNGASSVLVMANITDKEITVKVPMLFIGDNVTDQATGETLTLKQSVTIAPNGYRIFSK